MYAASEWLNIFQIYILSLLTLNSSQLLGGDIIQAFSFILLLRSSPPAGDHRQNVTTSQGEKCAASATYGSGTLTRLAGLSFHVPTSSTRSSARRESVIEQRGCMCLFSVLFCDFLSS